MKEILLNDLHSIKTMFPYIFLGIFLVIIYVFVLRFLFKISNSDEKKNDHVIKKRNSLYVVILLSWVILSLIGSVSMVKQIINLVHQKEIFISIILLLNLIFVLYFWLNGTKDIIYNLFFAIHGKKVLKKDDDIINNEINIKNARVLLLYCTCDDFDKNSLIQSMQQSYQNIKTVILDDSKEEKYLNNIDQTALEYNIEVIRRKNKTGFKAGNINNYLKDKHDYDFFVLLDSDEIIPNNFVSNALNYFNYYDNLGILQATHIATRNKTNFMNLFYIGVNSHWPIYQSMKQQYGFLSFLGHGAMISRKCYEDVKGFPHIVAEDIGFSIEAQECGYKVGFSNSIICQEEFPVDYIAFKKRHLKWTGGNLEFMKKYIKTIILSKKLKWFQKLDISMFTFNLPMSSVFFIFLSINLVLLPLLSYQVNYPLWLMTVTVIYLLSPMIGDMFFQFGKTSVLFKIKYFFSSFLLYGSLYWISFYGAAKSFIGIKPKFIVTPKENQKYSFFEIILVNYQEILFCISLFSIAVIFSHSFLPVILIVIPGFSSLFLSCLYKKNKNDKSDDNNIKKISKFN